MNFHPTLEEFRARCARGNLVPVWTELLADMETPVSAFKKLAGGGCAFLLESVEQGERIGRYSFLGVDPPTVIRSRGDRIETIEAGERAPRVDRGCPLDHLRAFMSRYRPVPDARLPPFVGGAVGYLGYDLVRSFERLPDANPDDLGAPECNLMIAPTVVAFDHVRRRMLIIHNARVEGAPETAHEEARARIAELAERLRAATPPAAASIESDNHPPAPTGEIRSNMSPEAYKEAVRRGKDYIFAGDIFQVVLSQRFERPYGGDPFDVYRALRAINPSPYMFYLKFDDVILAGSSPEVLVTVHDGRVQVRPIAGTRRRGATPEEDAALAAELLADPKERAEHIMLVDLGRNDCGRVAELGSVRVDDLMSVERYSHVMHIVSNVTGRLAAGRDGFDAIRAALPAGTLSGAPKIRAMEIIDELETLRRGPYGGAAGYIGFGGAVDACITIRTVVMKGGRAYVQAGAGIVADSDPESEYQETVNKAKGMFAAIEMAERGLR
jgi:anthranilate synthase component 1